MSFATLPTISKGTTTRMWVITIYSHPGGEGCSHLSSAVKKTQHVY